MKRQGAIVLLSVIRYPTDNLKAANGWKCSYNTAKTRLKTAAAKGLLHEESKKFIPTPELLQAWIEKGLLA